MTSCILYRSQISCSAYHNVVNTIIQSLSYPGAVRFRFSDIGLWARIPENQPHSLPLLYTHFNYYKSADVCLISLCVEPIHVGLCVFRLP